jgi:hypothetical protein
MNPWTKLYRDCYDSAPTTEQKDRFRRLLETQRKETKSDTQRIALALALEHIRAEEIMEHGHHS